MVYRTENRPTEHLAACLHLPTGTRLCGARARRRGGRRTPPCSPPRCHGASWAAPQRSLRQRCLVDLTEHVSFRPGRESPLRTRPRDRPASDSPWEVREARRGPRGLGRDGALRCRSLGRALRGGGEAARWGASGPSPRPRPPAPRPQHLPAAAGQKHLRSGVRFILKLKDCTLPLSDGEREGGGGGEWEGGRKEGEGEGESAPSSGYAEVLPSFGFHVGTQHCVWGPPCTCSVRPGTQGFLEFGFHRAAPTAGPGHGEAYADCPCDPQRREAGPQRDSRGPLGGGAGDPGRAGGQCSLSPLTVILLEFSSPAQLVSHKSCHEFSF